MGKRLLKLPRRLFGYQPASVDQLVADRDSMLTVAEQRVRSAEARIAELEEELSRRQEDLEAVTSTAGSRQVTAGSHPAIDQAPEPVHAAEVNRGAELDEPVELDDPTELAGAERETERTATPWTSDTSEPLPPAPALPVDADAGDVEEWLPRNWRRTVEFIPPPEPSADFDPMPIGNEDHDWTSPPAMPRYEQEAAVPVVPEQPSSGVSEEPEPWVTGAESYGQPWSAAERTEEPWSATGYRDEHPAEAAVTPLQITPAFMGEELASVLKTAEESASQIIRAWESTRNQISQVDRLWREVQAEIIRFAAWRKHVDPIIETMQKYIEEARARIDEVPSRIQEALSPAVEAMARLDECMAEFANASDVPELLGKLHADLAKALETDDFTSSTSETALAVEMESSQEGQPHQADANGAAGSHERIDMARVAQELRIMNESGESIPAPDNT
jgi:hypothetical protein